jgi:hypothetical protein
VGVGRLGMELGSTAGVLQPRVLGRMGETVSTTKRMVPSASNRVGSETGLWRQLALSATCLPSTYDWQPTRSWTSPSYCFKSSGLRTRPATRNHTTLGG